VPGAASDSIAGWLGEALKVRVSAPPERGRANVAVRDLLSQALGVSPQCVRIVAGAASARKIVEVTGLTDVQLRRRLAPLTR